VHGTWKIINHGQDINYTPKLSVTVHLNPDGTVSGVKTGIWHLSDDGKSFAITIDDIEYKGRLLRSYAADHDRWVMSFTAMSREGVALWGADVAVDV